MDIKTYRTPLTEERQKEYEKFLSTAGLRDEGDSDIIAWAKDDEGRLSAVGSLSGHILKQFAVAPEFEGTGMMAQIMTALTDEAYAAGRSRLFLCTKPANVPMISSLGFYTLAETEDAVLMENRRNGLDRFLASIQEDAAGYASEHGIDLANAVCGAVVCNCDPFTLGHRHLIEYASKNCDFLYIFAVSESGSMFEPADRLNMIKAGTADIENCRVYESEHYLVSRATFPAYFIRDEEHADEVRSEIDIKLFAERIAPVLGIRKRFVGEEPFSPVTAAYNQKMKEMLPGYGIELTEIPRLESGSPAKAVSASRVRELLRAGDKESVRTLLPGTTSEIIERVLTEKEPCTEL